MEMNNYNMLNKGEFMEIRKSTMDDLAEMQRIYAIAREFMKKTGNPNQWRDDKPRESDLINDIEKGNSYLVLSDGEIVGVFSMIPGRDPTYGYIEAGSWLNDEPYVTIHRIASSGRKSGVFSAAIDYALSVCNNVRIDTHKDNKVMQHLTEKKGFVRCGIIYLEDGDSRIAYHLAA